MLRSLTLLSFTTVTLATICESYVAFSFKLHQPPSSFGFKTLERSYLLHINGHVGEWSCQSPLRSMALILTGLSRRTISCHASPTLFNAVTPKPNWVHASLSPWKRTQSRASTRLWRIVLWLARPLEGLVWASTAFVLWGSCASFFPFCFLHLTNIWGLSYPTNGDNGVSMEGNRR